MIRFASMALAIAAFAAAPAFADDATVKIGHGTVEPAEVTISTGESVTFRNEKAMPGGHTVVSDDGKFRSHSLAKGETYTETFDEAGRYPYHIEEHPSGTGVIVVE